MKRFFIWILVVVSFVLSFKRAHQKIELKALKNPAALSDAKWASEPGPTRVLAPSGVFSQNLLSRTFKTPNLSAIQVALWQGDLRGLPFWLLQKYRERGLLQVLALSGQHVWALALCLSCLGTFIWKRWPGPRGKVLLWGRRLKMPLAAAVLLGVAPNEPSIVRTALCVAVIFFYRENPLILEPEYSASLIGFLILTLFPELLFSKGFQLSLVGVIGVLIMGRCFLPRQKLLAGGWLIAWFAPVMALFFGKWVGDSIFLQIMMGLIWDQVFLPLLFLVGIVILILPTFFATLLGKACEKVLELWLNWEAAHVKTSGVSIYWPSFSETAVFLVWLVALAYWNRRRCQNE